MTYVTGAGGFFEPARMELGSAANFEAAFAKSWRREHKTKMTNACVAAD